jgi:hypothetical protein
MLRDLFWLLAPPSAHTIYHHRARAGVRSFRQQGAAVLAVPRLARVPRAASGLKQ